MYYKKTYKKMKKTYQKPNLRSIKLLHESALLTNSLGLGRDDQKIDVGNALSNEEGKHDIWGNDGNGIW